MKGSLDPGSGVCDLGKLGVHVAEERSTGSSGLRVQQQQGVQRMSAQSAGVRLKKHFIPEGHHRKNEKY